MIIKVFNKLLHFHYVFNKKLEKKTERMSKIKPFIDKYDWKDRTAWSGKDYWNNFEKIIQQFLFKIYVLILLMFLSKLTKYFPLAFQSTTSFISNKKRLQLYLGACRYKGMCWQNVILPKYVIAV